MKKYVEKDVKIHLFLTPVLVEDVWSASRPCFFTPGKSCRYPLDRRLDGTQSRSERHGKEKKFPLTPGLELGLLAI
jgi:hypothetical protein